MEDLICDVLRSCPNQMQLALKSHDMGWYGNYPGEGLVCFGYQDPRELHGLRSGVCGSFFFTLNVKVVLSATTYMVIASCRLEVTSRSRHTIAP